MSALNFVIKTKNATLIGVLLCDYIPTLNHNTTNCVTPQKITYKISGSQPLLQLLIKLPCQK